MGTSTANDTSRSHDLGRFVKAQAGIYEQALAELRAGQKRSHWMWYVFPQILGLGRSSTARRYAIRSRAEAAAYLSHPVLGDRLRACAEALLSIEGRSASEIFGTPDDQKFQSSLTLFAAVPPPESAFERLLRKYFHGRTDQATVVWLGEQTAPDSDATSPT